MFKELGSREYFLRKSDHLIVPVLSHGEKAQAVAAWLFFYFCGGILHHFVDTADHQSFQTLKDDIGVEVKTIKLEMELRSPLVEGTIIPAWH